MQRSGVVNIRIISVAQSEDVLNTRDMLMKCSSLGLLITMLLVTSVSANPSAHPEESETSVPFQDPLVDLVYTLGFMSRSQKYGQSPPFMRDLHARHKICGLDVRYRFKIYGHPDALDAKANISIRVNSKNYIKMETYYIYHDTMGFIGENTHNKFWIRFNAWPIHQKLIEVIRKSKCKVKIKYQPKDKAYSIDIIEN